MAWLRFISNRIITLLKLTVLFMYYLYQAVFFIAVLPKAVFTISNVCCLDFLCATAVQEQPFSLFRFSVSHAFVRRRMTSKLALWRH